MTTIIQLSQQQGYNTWTTKSALKSFCQFQLMHYITYFTVKSKLNAQNIKVTSHSLFELGTSAYWGESVHYIYIVIKTITQI